MRFANLSVDRSGTELEIAAQVYMDDVAPETVRVELYAEPTNKDEEPVRLPMEQTRALQGAVQGFVYELKIQTERPPEDFTARIVPAHPDALVPLEAPWVLWQR
jgi:starch phosphorylase